MILKFPTEGDRAAFIDRLDHVEPDLAKYVKPSYSQPQVVNVRSSDRSILRRLREIWGGNVETWDDVQFEVFGGN